MDKRNGIKRIILISLLVICIVFVNQTIIMASDSTSCQTPNENQNLELRAVEVKDVAGQNKQVIMELWANDIEFERI